MEMCLNIKERRLFPYTVLCDYVFTFPLQANGITYVLNVSTSCQKPPFIPEGQFLRIPVNDNYSDKLLPYFQDAFQFLGKFSVNLLKLVKSYVRCKGCLVRYAFLTCELWMKNIWKYSKKMNFSVCVVHHAMQKLPVVHMILKIKQNVEGEIKLVLLFTIHRFLNIINGPRKPVKRWSK